MVTIASKPDLDRMAFPKELAPILGLSIRELAYLKVKGCPFYGRKTTLRWVRAFLAQEAGAAAPCRERAVRPRRSVSSRRGAPSSSSDSRDALSASLKAQPCGTGK